MRFSLFCKSFRNDLSRFVRLLDSAEQHSDGKVPFVLSVPRSDRSLFLDRIGTGRVNLLCDEDILGQLTQQSWRQQQLVKLNAWRVDFADAWLGVDSDFYFVRPFGPNDFVRADGRVAFVASTRSHVLDDELQAAQGSDFVAWLRGTGTLASGWPGTPEYVDRKRLGTIGWYESWLDAVRRPSHLTRLERIQAFFGRMGPVLNFMPGPVWTRDCLESLENEFLRPRNLDFNALIKHSPWEAVWAGEWEVWRGLPNRYAIEQPFLHIRSDATIIRARSEGLTENTVATRYLGLQLAARHQEFETLDPLP
jgi:hypothetical protein